jgi:hypothetical protein
MVSDHVSATGGKIVKDLMDNTIDKENVMNFFRKKNGLARPEVEASVVKGIRNEADVSSSINSMSRMEFQ